MSNALDKKIERGERVVVSRSYFEDLVKHASVESRTFICEHGYGMSPFTMGSKITGRWADGTGADVIVGSMIDVEETRKLQQVTHE